MMTISREAARRLQTHRGWWFVQLLHTTTILTIDLYSSCPCLNMCGGGPVERKTQTPQHICTWAMERTIKMNYFLLLKGLRRQKDIYKTYVLGVLACCIRTERDKWMGWVQTHATKLFSRKCMICRKKITDKVLEWTQMPSSLNPHPHVQWKWFHTPFHGARLQRAPHY